ncbi:hypothetical protein [Schleiferilactobacillus harbinensis]|uniref:hypothetical protein n=1 Tax=Schleiferilactobacillus harbinensis TaxID=304207 RepID=UPI002F26B360
MARENNNLPVRTYQKQFAQLLQAVYRKQAYFNQTLNPVNLLQTQIQMSFFKDRVGEGVFFSPRFSC